MDVMKNNPFAPQNRVHDQSTAGGNNDDSTSHGLKRKRGRPPKSRFLDLSKSKAAEEAATLQKSTFDAHHDIPASKQVWLDVTKVAAMHRDDPSMKVIKLKFCR